MIGRDALLACLHDGVPWTETLFAQRLDLHREDHGIADQDADKRDDAQDRHEAQRRIAEKQSDNDANQRQRRDRGDQEEQVETPQLQHQDGRHGEQHQRHHREDRTFATSRFPRPGRRWQGDTPQAGCSTKFLTAGS